MGKTAFPERPPNRFPRIGLPIGTEMRMAFTVLMATMASAPPRSAAAPISVMSVTFGVTFTQVGLPRAFTARVHSSTRPGSVPRADPNPSAWGQERFSSKPAAESANQDATLANSPGSPPKMLTTTGSPRRAGSSPAKSRDGFGRPMAFRSPPSWTTRHGPGWPSRGTGPMDLVTTPPAPSRRILPRDAPVVPRIPAARMRWFRRPTPPTVTGPDGDLIIRRESAFIYLIGYP